MTEPALPPPLTLTGDDPTDEALALLRATTEGIHRAADEQAALAAERRRIVLDLREQRGVKFALIAAAAGSTEQTIYKVHREAKDERRDLAHDRGDHRWCPLDPDGVCRTEAAEIAEAAELAAREADARIAHEATEQQAALDAAELAS